MAPQLFWIGLGNMGRGMAKNLAEKGGLDKPLLIYNRTRTRTDAFTAAVPKTEAVDSIGAGVGRADMVMFCLSNDAAVEETVAAILQAPGGLAGKTVVDNSTIHPDTTERVARQLTAAGAAFVACPVFGAPPMADAGQLLFVPAGPRAAVDALRPYMVGVMGRAELPFDDQPYGAAAKMKLIGNTFVLNMVTQLGESFTLAERSGVGVAPVQKFVDAMFGGVYSAYAGRMVTGDYWKRDEPLFSADNALKDVGHALSLAEASGVDAKNPKAAQQYLEKVKAEKGGQKGDIAGIYGAVRTGAGLKYENDA